MRRAAAAAPRAHAPSRSALAPRQACARNACGAQVAPRQACAPSACAAQVLVERFSLTDDVVSRVLGGGVANRWLTRLRPTDEWLAGRLARSGDGASEDGLGAFFAYAVGRDREGALERGCSLEDAEWRGCDVEETTAEPERLISTYLTSLTASS